MGEGPAPGNDVGLELGADLGIDLGVDLGIDKVVHEPARLGILSILAGAREADFRFLQSALDLTKGNLSSHLSRLEDAGLVTVTKGYEGRTPRTMLAITADGRRALDRHWAQLDAIRRLGR